MTRLLVTGGAGFIGSHAVEHVLAETDWDVTVLDGLTYAGDVHRLTETDSWDPDRVDIVWHDLRAPIPDTTARRIGTPDIVWNFAANSHVDRSIEEPVPFVVGNVQAALHMLEWARHARPKLFVQVSTDEVYGPGSADDGHLEWAPIVPSNPYSASKASQEAVAISYWRTYDVPVVLTNTMNNFGERQHPEKFVPLVIRRLLVDEPIPVHARRHDHEGRWEFGSRCWLHARNHADALLHITRTMPAGRFPDVDRPDRYHIAGEPLDNATVARTIADILGVEPDIQPVDYHQARPGHDMHYGLADRYLAGLGWKPPVPMRESLERTVRWTVAHPEWL